MCYVCCGEMSLLNHKKCVKPSQVRPAKLAFRHKATAEMHQMKLTAHPTCSTIYSLASIPTSKLPHNQRWSNNLAKDNDDFVCTVTAAHDWACGIRRCPRDRYYRRKTNIVRNPWVPQEMIHVWIFPGKKTSALPGQQLLQRNVSHCLRDVDPWCKLTSACRNPQVNKKPKWNNTNFSSIDELL